MNTSSELERIVGSWLESRVAEPPHGSLRSALARVDGVQQQRHRWLPGWPSSVDDRPSILRASAIAAGAVGLVATAMLIVPWVAVDPDPPPDVSGTTWTVAPDGGDFSTISEAVAAAQDGDTVLVAPGTYGEALVIDKDIVLRGTGVEPRDVVVSIPDNAPTTREALPTLAPTLHGSQTPAHPPVGVQLLATSATLANLQVIGLDDGLAVLVRGGTLTLDSMVVSHAKFIGGTDPPCAVVEDSQPTDDEAEVFAGALFVLDGADVTVERSRIMHNIRVDEGSALRIHDAFLSYPTVAVQGSSTLELDGSSVWACGSSVSPCECPPVSVTGGSTAAVRDNQFHDGGIAVRGTIGTRTSAMIEGNTFSSAPREAIHVTTGAQAAIVGNRFYGNGHAVTVSHAGATIRDNTFVSNTTAINLAGADALVAGNSISAGDVGISTIMSGTSDIRDNTVQGLVSRGISVGGGTRPTIEGNNACGSGVDLYIEPSAHPVMGDNDICIEGPAMGG
jgi:hypothetical protein